MLKTYVSKFAMDILPSVAATIIGAYIVNHYIVSKPAGAPAAVAASTSEPKAEAKAAPEAAKAIEKPAEVANIPEAGVKAKGISEKVILEKSAVEKPAEKSAEKPVEKSADKPAETASIPPVETRKHQPRERAIAKVVPAPVQPAAPLVAPPPTAASVEAAVAPEERRDANDLARAAIERLRGTNDGSQRPQEAARIPDVPRIPDPARIGTAPVASAPSVPPVVSAPAVRPLPPPIMVSTPSAETFDAPAGTSAVKPAYPGAARIDDPLRPTPPADIPATGSPSRPLDLHAEMTERPAREHTTVAEDVLSAAKSVFHAVLPKKLSE